MGYNKRYWEEDGDQQNKNDTEFSPVSKNLSGYRVDPMANTYDEIQRLRNRYFAVKTQKTWEDYRKLFNETFGYDPLDKLEP